MPNQRRARKSSSVSSSIPDGRVTPLASTRDQSPQRHHGGQELPDDLQDRPEQNAGYDAAVRGVTGTTRSPENEAEVVELQPDYRDADLEVTPADSEEDER